MGIRIPTLLEAILEATAIEAAAKARIAGLRTALEAEARRRLAEEGAAPTWKAPKLGSVRLDPPGDWTASVADPAAFGSYVAERHPDEATAVIRLPAALLGDALTALGFAGMGPATVEATVEVRPTFASKYLEGLIVDVEEEPREDGTVDRTITVVDPAGGELVDGVTATRANANGKLVVSMDRDRRRAALEAAKAEAEAIVAEATGQPAPAEVAAGRTVTLEELTASGVVRPASDLPSMYADMGREYAGNGHAGPGDELVSRPRYAAKLAAQAAERAGHRPPYVGEGSDGARRSAQIDREEADALDGLLRADALASAERWDQQAAELEETEAGRYTGSVGEASDRAILAQEAQDTKDLLNGRSREQLRSYARNAGINPGGTKPELITRIVEAGKTARDVDTYLEGPR